MPNSRELSVFMTFGSGRSRDRSPNARLLVLSLRVVAGRNAETSESCGKDAGDVCVVELEEPVDKPGTTIGTSFSVLHCIRLPSSMSCGF